MPDIDWVEVEIGDGVVIEAPRRIKRAYVSGPPCVAVHRVGIPDTVIVTGEQACTTHLILVQEGGIETPFEVNAHVRPAPSTETGAEDTASIGGSGQPRADWLALTTGGMVAIETPTAFVYTFVADPTIAEVVPATPRLFAFRALRTGQTNLIIGLPDKDPTLYEVTVEAPTLIDSAVLLRPGDRLPLDFPPDTWKVVAGDEAVVALSKRKGTWVAIGREAGFADVVGFVRSADPLHVSLVVADPEAPVWDSR